MALALKAPQAKRAGRGRVAKSARTRGAPLRLTASLGQEVATGADVTWILTPWLPPAAKERDIWLSILPSHDINQALLDALPIKGRARANVFAGVLAIDPFRTRAGLIRRIKAAGLTGAVNFPSASFVDGETRKVFERMSFGLDREIEFLAACVAEGLRVGGVTNSVESAKKLISIGAEFLIVHAGPATSREPDPGKDLLASIKALAEARKLTIVPIAGVLPD
jgi:predicted TIM-barrel enzyme